jgi:hypothetical protein
MSEGFGVLTEVAALSFPDQGRGVKALAHESISAPRLGFHSLVEIIQSYLNAGADGRYVSDEEIANEVTKKTNHKMHPGTVSKNTPFLLSLGLIEGRKKHFRLAPMGIKLAKSLVDQPQVAPSIFADAIRNEPLVSQTLAFVTTDVPEEVLMKKIIENTDLRIIKNRKTPARAVIDMLAYARLLDKNFDSGTGKIMISVSGKSPQTKPAASVAINVTINVDANTDREQLKSIIRTIREVLAEEQSSS